MMEREEKGGSQLVRNSIYEEGNWCIIEGP